MTDLSIVIITDRYKAHLKNCLDSLSAYRPAALYEVIVVNRENADGTQDMLKAFYPHVKNINLKMRFSISRYRNVGLKNAQGRHILFADADILFLRDTVDKFVSFMDSNKDVGLSGGKLFGMDGQLQYSCRTLYTWPIILSRRVFRKEGLENQHLMKGWDHNSPKEVDWVGGGFSCIRREAFLKVGFLDERFGYGFEDVDYCLRMWNNDWKVMYTPEAAARHMGFRQSAGLNLWALRHCKSALAFFLKYKGWGKAKTAVYV